MESVSSLRPDIVEHLQNLYNSSFKVSVYASGCNSNLLGWLTLVPGASKCIVEGRNPYAIGATVEILGKKPDALVSIDTSRGLASGAFINSQRFLLSDLNFELESFQDKALAIGATGALRTDRERKGPDHAYITLMDEKLTVTYYIALEKTRTRQEEDFFISLKTLELALMFTKGKYKDLETVREGFNENESITIVEEISTFEYMFSRLGAEERELTNIILLPNGRFLVNLELEGYALLPGSFNPVHDAHIKLAEQAAIAAGINKNKVIFEVSLNNVDKASISSEIIKTRLEGLHERGCIAMISKRPYFVQKNELIKNGFFIVGSDTFIRIVDKKYYDNDHEQMIGKLAAFTYRKNKFIVAPRVDSKTGELLTLKSITTPSLLKDLVLELEEFRMDLSSTEIRASQNQ